MFKGNNIDLIAIVNEQPGNPPPFYDRHVFVCVNERPEDDPRGCGKRKGSETLLRYMKGQVKALGLRRVRINSAGCLDRCAFGPTLVIYPEGVWYKVETEAEVDEIVQTHLVEGGRVERLLLPGRRIRTADAPAGAAPAEA